MPERKGRTCFVPLCKGGYKSFKEKVSLFRALADPVRLQEWARNIKRGDKALDETCVVCSRHFDDRYIQRTFKHVINGEDVEFDRERPSLTPDAVPTIFPNGPAYLTKPVPRKRKERNIADCTAPPAKRKRRMNSRLPRPVTMLPLARLCILSLHYASASRIELQCHADESVQPWGPALPIRRS
ncbi:hypothetical protein HPB51_001398 [Rhipicephalus microplus]|uniref:THAP-type domain-containing protein n=1 Tax=Rhipicephalus microplus TaxID=6941 RepID=A0A9J6EEI8_RHIMP|nr:hypothetical protein HPB51_001398 [Rhipicephalus microplus]